MSHPQYEQAQAVAADENADGDALFAAANELFQTIVRGDLTIGILPMEAAPLVVHLAERAGFAGNPRGWLLVSVLFSAPDGMLGPQVTRDVGRAAAALNEGARSGDQQLVARYARFAHAATPDDIPEPALEGHRREAATHLANLMEHDPDPELRVVAAWMLKDGHGWPADPAAARRLLDEAAAAGHPDAHFELYVYDTTGVAGPEDPESALGHLRAAAEAGSVRAMANLGGMYATGNGLPVDEAQSVQWYTRAAEGGHARAAMVLSRMYATGEGAPQDDALAERYADLAEQLS